MSDNNSLSHLELRVEHYEGIRLMALQRNHLVMIDYAEKSIFELRSRISNIMKKKSHHRIFSK